MINKSVIKKPLQKINLKSKKTLGLIFALVLIIIAAVYLLSFFDKSKQDENLYAEVAGHKIYKQEVENLIGDNEDVSVQDATKALADKYFTEKIGEENGITVSDEDMQQEYGAEYDGDIKDLQKSDPYAYQRNVNKLYFNKLATYHRGDYKGKVLVGHFSRNIAYDTPLLEEQKMLNKNLGDPEAIARDKKYAKDLLTKLYEQIKSDEITFDEAIKIEHNDSVLGKKAYGSLSHSGKFDTGRFLDSNSLIEGLNVKSQISVIESGELTEPFLAGSSEGDEEGSYFLVIKMDESVGGGSGVSLEQYLDDSKKRLGYKIYV